MSVRTPRERQLDRRAEQAPRTCGSLNPPAASAPSQAVLVRRDWAAGGSDLWRFVKARICESAVRVLSAARSAYSPTLYFWSRRSSGLSGEGAQAVPIAFPRGTQNPLANLPSPCEGLQPRPAWLARQPGLPHDFTGSRASREPRARRFRLTRSIGTSRARSQGDCEQKRQGGRDGRTARSARERWGMRTQDSSQRQLPRRRADSRIHRPREDASEGGLRRLACGAAIGAERPGQAGGMPHSQHQAIEFSRRATRSQSCRGVWCAEPKGVIGRSEERPRRDSCRAQATERAARRTYREPERVGGA